jgi:hypothetical protein
MMGDVYVDFINKKDNWDERLNETYKKYPQQVNGYLEYMAAHFTQTLLSTPDEDKAEDVSINRQDWLATYAKALRNMAETVINTIKAKRSLTQDEKRDALHAVSKAILLHLDGTPDIIKTVLDEKSSIKLTDFIESLRKNVNKVSPVKSYSNTGFFSTTQPSSSASENNQLDNQINLASS